MNTKRERTYECCANCKHRHKIQRWDYSKGGCDHTSLEGLACTGLAYEDGVVIWMVGLNEGTGMCECWEEAENG